MPDGNTALFHDDRMLAHEPDVDVPFLPGRLDRRIREILAGLNAQWKYPEHPGRLRDKNAWLDVDTTAVSEGSVLAAARFHRDAFLDPDQK